MATTYVPTDAQIFDTRDGNAFMIFSVQHVNGVDTLINVPDAAVSVAELPSTNAAPTLASVAGSDTAAANPSSNQVAVQNATSGASGLNFTYVAGDGVKQVIIDTGSTSGTYLLVVRMIGSAAGLGSTGDANL